MKYAYEDLSEDQFEILIVILCQRILGIAVQGFAKGPDGGRDAKFIGIAELFPSIAEKWNGITIIQAKHTNGYNKSFSDTDFFSLSSNNTVIGKEIPRIRKLRESKQLDNYMLFSNRRLPGKAESEIRNAISISCNLPVQSIFLCGLEQLEVWLKKFPEVPNQADLDPVDSPLIVSPDELAEVIQALAEQIENLSELLDDAPTDRISFEQKNSINNMSSEYAKNLIKKYLKETSQIHTFLSSPENHSLLRLYELAADEFQLKIISKRKNYQNFDEVMEYLVKLLLDRDPILRQRQHRRLLRAVLFYMYWNCDIGVQIND